MTCLLAAVCLQAYAAPLPVSNEFVVDYREGMLWLKVHAPQSSNLLNFLLDSGAGVSVLNLHTARKLNIPLGDRVSVSGVGSSTTGYWPQHLSLNLNSLSLSGDYLAVDLNALGDACRCRVDGLLGADFFHDRIVQIDFAASKLRILSQYTPEPGANVLPLKNHRGAFLVQASVDSAKPRWLRLDTGFASALAIVDPRAHNQATRSRLAVALSEATVPVTTTTLKLGSLTLPSVPTDLHKEQIFSGESGLLGNGLLSRFRTVTIDSKSGLISFSPFLPAK